MGRGSSRVTNIAVVQGKEAWGKYHFKAKAESAGVAWPLEEHGFLEPVGAGSAGAGGSQRPKTTRYWLFLSAEQKRGDVCFPYLNQESASGWSWCGTTGDGGDRQSGVGATAGLLEARLLRCQYKKVRLVSSICFAVSIGRQYLLSSVCPTVSIGRQGWCLRSASPSVQKGKICYLQSTPLSVQEGKAGVLDLLRRQYRKARSAIFSLLRYQYRKARLVSSICFVISTGR
ncbi:hypothetical protein GOBAR_DD09812 [Gossypium barbadense]|nr:hypothetical protein GOBAR_DD09812 [Gossypium barbadense]